jgi:hypothetical protein
MMAQRGASIKPTRVVSVFAIAGNRGTEKWETIGGLTPARGRPEYELKFHFSGRGEKKVGLEQGRNARTLPRAAQQPYGSPPDSNLWRKDPRSIPKVFLIEAYEVS